MKIVDATLCNYIVQSRYVESKEELDKLLKVGSIILVEIAIQYLIFGISQILKLLVILIVFRCKHMTSTLHSDTINLELQINRVEQPSLWFMHQYCLNTLIAGNLQCRVTRIKFGVGTLQLCQGDMPFYYLNCIAKVHLREV